MPAMKIGEIADHQHVKPYGAASQHPDSDCEQAVEAKIATETPSSAWRPSPRLLQASRRHSSGASPERQFPRGASGRR